MRDRTAVGWNVNGGTVVPPVRVASQIFLNESTRLQVEHSSQLRQPFQIWRTRLKTPKQLSHEWHELHKFLQVTLSASCNSCNSCNSWLEFFELGIAVAAPLRLTQVACRWIRWQATKFNRLGLVRSVHIRYDYTPVAQNPTSYFAVPLPIDSSPDQRRLSWLHY